MAPPPPPRPAVRSRWEKLASRRAPSAPRPHPVYLSRGSRWQARPVPGAGPTARADRGWRLLTKPLCSFAGRHRPPEHWHHSSACPAGRRPRCRPRAGRGARGGTHVECHQRGQTQPAAATHSRPLSFLPLETDGGPGSHLVSLRTHVPRGRERTPDSGEADAHLCKRPWSGLPS